MDMGGFGGGFTSVICGIEIDHRTALHDKIMMDMGWVWGRVLPVVICGNWRLTAEPAPTLNNQLLNGYGVGLGAGLQFYLGIED
ncbi:hypothetical protein AAEJ74_07455 [Limnospira fusiformis PMC 851.14]|uniref:Uncharacterized protein n=1 Tax=Limnospira fusiformis PMC 851.14 TaxID=2219512 RepID=A0ABU9EHX2_LIMFS